MLSTKSSRFNGLLPALMITVASGMSAFTLAQVPDLAVGWTAAAQSGSPAAGASDDTSSEQLIGETWRRTELYFGTEKPNGSAVTPQEFEDFVDEIVTPRFPEGLTLLSGDGQWRDSAGTIIEEESNLLILLYPLDDEEADGEIEQIREAYKDFFQQESVLRVDSYSRVSF
jgi:hypothetical protein